MDTENQMWECQFERGLRLALSNELTKAHEQLKTFQEVKAKNKTMDYELRTTRFKLGNYGISLSITYSTKKGFKQK